MPVSFAVGQIWEADFDGRTRQLRVEAITDDGFGFKANFRFLDDGDTATEIGWWTVTAAQKWRYVSG
ncbi:hypothetical protein [Nitrospirillum sp. BR 11828]|uniref:hypothetical protein n=1 Tax=Nitrospirillum sp. BR 11828 TaxID=3104325 RepID=UPI002ACA3403|nr:hypothetical protein [Nitrospirillum sp. BR 11828]MDZ5647164.1 hypothetical protein [Nitrospirillum sp. BR 11828]